MLHRYASAPDEPWKNGAGTTRRLYADAGLRVSVATIAQDGPFSVFPGLERVFIPVDAAVALAVDGVVSRAEPWTATRFPGDATVSAGLLEGPTRVLNLMFDPALLTLGVRIEPVHGPVADAVLLTGEGLSSDGEPVSPLDLVLGEAGLHGLVARISRRPPACD
ncbi:HutD/Ves family protein [Kineosporia succinea]|uniref:Environmental stress-induced protein Ves n=1 Tax=Kineosporia succinea TaxID=84632 RepID=A0ABT9PFD5_9ACTN|nr:HutD family protein [Kineosporia succinea]MDP9830690.1 environmental stress-induced protein Ves [Kineosporia succinea]